MKYPLRHRNVVDVDVVDKYMKIPDNDIFGDRLVLCDPADIVGRITLVRLGFVEILLDCVSADELRALFLKLRTKNYFNSFTM